MNFIRLCKKLGFRWVFVAGDLVKCYNPKHPEIYKLFFLKELIQYD